jgi:hypothetical protein
MLNDPNFLSCLLLLGLILYQFYLHGRTDKRLGWLEPIVQRMGKELDSAGRYCNLFEEYAKASLDVKIHTNAELARLRESVLELARDVEGLAVLEQITLRAVDPQFPCQRITKEAFTSTRPPPKNENYLTNQVFARHLPLPRELPEETQQQYLPWTCPICETEYPHSWTWWCPNCRSRTRYPGTIADGLSDTLDHEPTEPCAEPCPDVTCFACRRTFTFDDHPLLVICPHCGAHQIKGLEPQGLDS